MNSDLTQIYEINLQKNYDLLNTQISKSQLYEEQYLDSIIDSMDNLLIQTSKTTKNYIIGLTLEGGKTQINSPKIKKAEDTLKEYEKKVKEIKDRHIKNRNTKKEIIPRYNKEEMSQSIESIEYNSFNKMNNAIRAATEIENMSGNILVDLNGQTNVMKNSVKKVGELNEELDVSKNYLNKMINKTNSDKKIIVVVGTVLFFITVSVLFYKLYSKFRVYK